MTGARNMKPAPPITNVPDAISACPLAVELSAWVAAFEDGQTRQATGGSGSAGT